MRSIQETPVWPIAEFSQALTKHPRAASCLKTVTYDPGIVLSAEFHGYYVRFFEGLKEYVSSGIPTTAVSTKEELRAVLEKDFSSNGFRLMTQE